MAARSSQVSNRFQSPVRRGLTLLELILALSLSVVLLFSVGMALRLYWRSFDVKRSNVEQSHLARAILQHIDRDLRSAVQSTPVDLSGLETMTSSSALAGAFAGMTGTGSPAATAAGGATGSATGGGAAGGSGGATAPMQTGQSSTSGGAGATGSAASSSASKTGGATGGTSSGSSSSTGGGTATSGQSAPGEASAEESTTTTPPSVVGLYGSANQLQFDVSRLPRVDEYAGGSPTSMVQIPSDIKTLTYYVRSESTEGGSSSAPGSSTPSTTGQGRGLMRLEMDRAVSAYSETNGSLAANYDNAKLLADEVTSITFRYWNGTEWATDWNSDDMGGLPLAIEVVMTMADPNADATANTSVQNFAAPAATSTEPSYRMVVNLPTASLPPPAEEPATEGDAAATSSGASGSGGATSGASGGSAAGGSTGSSKSGATK